MKKYMVVLHQKNIDRISNIYFESKRDVNRYLDTLKGNKFVEVLHVFKIEEVK